MGLADHGPVLLAGAGGFLAEDFGPEAVAVGVVGRSISGILDGHRRRALDRGF